ncbi:hypothetical protein MG293_006966 [Ovis ammon polii]|uniref:C-X-C motif chemokine n=2 Tax=Ovis TaxID=9935 RepID=A0A836A4P4_SHEEP|nr:hypothetical protein JEQ12_017507 [Ovis aries]KAI4542840.1 hypothetical protein MG293_006966 [Ovis ammon polii]
MLLLLLVAAGRRAAGAPVVNELRCQCLQTVQGIHLKNMQSVKVTPPGPHCGQTEVIATLKTGQEVCLNPAAPMVKKIIDKMLNHKGNDRTLFLKLYRDLNIISVSRNLPLALKANSMGIISTAVLAQVDIQCSFDIEFPGQFPLEVSQQEVKHKACEVVVAA